MASKKPTPDITLATSKRICQLLMADPEKGASTQEKEVLRDLAKSLYKMLKKAARANEDAKRRSRAELDVLRTEMELDRIDREANSARIVERQKFLFERTGTVPGKALSFERAFASAAFVEQALVNLCTHANFPSRGSQLLATRPRARDAPRTATTE
jgi:hypothetical protein